MSTPNCQQEPRYTDEPTVTFSLRYPNLCCHMPTAHCQIQEPHAVAECGALGVPLAAPQQQEPSPASHTPGPDR